MIEGDIIEDLSNVIFKSVIEDGRRIQIRVGLTPEEITARDAEHAEHIATQQAYEAEQSRPAALPRLVIIDRMTDDEIVIVAELQFGTPEQQRWWLRWVSVVDIRPDDPVTLEGFESLFGEERTAELLAPE